MGIGILQRTGAIVLIYACWIMAAQAAVTGPCSNCHTMHNSQNGGAMAYTVAGAADETPNPKLLVTDCLGCHSSTNGNTWKDPVTGAPIVYSSVPPTFGATADGMSYQGLAAGNFYWVTQHDANGHNIFTRDGTLSGAPGDASGCQRDSCHVNFSDPYQGQDFLQGRRACEGCHMVTGNNLGPSITSWHHRNAGGPVVNSASQGWYRFLAGHQRGDGHGVSGIEDPEWERSPSESVHNEYLGFAGNKLSDEGFFRLGNTMTAFCVGCHGMFHVQDETATGASPWLRHPSDAVLPGSGEYLGYTVYNPLAPVARSSLAVVSPTVTPGTDMVMCLSCHRAHASPYRKMMRWNYSGDLQQALTGCGTCHTWKK